MIFEKIIRIPHERIAVLIGKRGAIKSAIERRCGVVVRIDSTNGEVSVTSAPESDAADDMFSPLKAVEIIIAIGRGFAPDTAMTLLKDDHSLHVINLTDFAGKSRSGIERIKSRVIGERGRARKNMEQLSGTRISVYGKTVAIIGAGSGLKRAVDAVSAISGGSMHGAVYSRLESANRRQKQERMIMWEGRGIGNGIDRDIRGDGGA